MSQANGQRAGTRSNGQRNRGQSSQPSPYQQKKPYIKTAPVKEPAQTASIFKTRSFKLLVDAIGAENVALGLDSNLTRVAELANGERFTPETAFHMETTLGLPDGFFDQPNPALSPETIARLKSPLDYIQAHAAFEAADVRVEQVEQANVAALEAVFASTDNELLKEAAMPTKKKSTTTPVAAKKSVAAPNVKKALSSKSTPVPKIPSQQSLGLHDERTARIPEIRRANLHVLTERNGSKSQLGRLLELSQSNIAHRLHGQKRMDDAEAARFTDRLGLPAGWLDTLRATADIPESVTNLLAPPNRRGTSANAGPAVPGETVPTAAKPSRLKRHTGRQARAKPENTHDATGWAVTSSNDHHSKSEQLSNDEVSFATEASAIASTTPSPVTHDAYPSTSATSLETLQGIPPIAEALIKTLAGKARTGRLDETRALHLLQQAILL